MSLHSHHGARQPQSHTQKRVMERCGWINSMPPDVNTSSVLEFEIVILNELGCWDSNVSLVLSFLSRNGEVRFDW
ncbi:hypothetical protein ACFX12_033280 [Malus domestica]